MVQTLQVYIYLDMQISYVEGIGFRLLAHESRDLPQAETKIIVVRSSRSVLVFGCWLMSYMIYLKLRQK